MSRLIILFCLIQMSAFKVFPQDISKAGDVSRRVIAADFLKIKGKHNKFFREAVGAGRAAEGLRADWQRDLAMVHRECGFKYIRFHGLLHDEMGVYSEDKNGNPIYKFHYIDALFDAILKIGMKPFVEFGFMPESLASGKKTVFWWNGNITPPKDYRKWEQLIQALVKHWTERYGETEVRQWYFEVWNEPNLDIFWSGNQAEYFKLYRSTASAVKAVSPAYRIGGPATAGRGWISEMIAYASQNKIPLDFISTHDYGVKGIGIDETSTQQLFLDRDPNAIIGGVREARDKIRASAMPNLPLHYTEWSSSYSPRDPVHDSYISAAYILSKLKGSEGSADSMSYWTFTDIFEENGVVPSPFHGGFGMVNFQGLRKPSFYAYQFLNRLGDEELLTNDEESWVCRNKNGVQILFWNFTPPQTKESNQKFYKGDIPANNIGSVRLSIAGLPSGNFQMSIYQIGYQVNDVYTNYLKINSPQHLTREQVERLASNNSGRSIESSRISISRGRDFTREIKLRENDVFLVVLEKQ